MSRAHAQTITCPICHGQFHHHVFLHGELLRNGVVDIIHAEHPEWTQHDVICSRCVNHYRAEYVQQMLQEEKGELGTIEQDVIQSMRDQATLSGNVNEAFEKQRTFGERVSDGLATFGGSWVFIISFAAVLIFWIILNTINLLRKPFDPYPYILLNLVLSCLAAVQAPIIMMSQNRQESRDRLRAENDYQVNLKAELEIRNLHAKIDMLLNHQWQHLLEIQEIQTEMMSELGTRGAVKRGEGQA